MACRERVEVVWCVVWYDQQPSRGEGGNKQNGHPPSSSSPPSPPPPLSIVTTTANRTVDPPPHFPVLPTYQTFPPSLISCCLWRRRQSRGRPTRLVSRGSSPTLSLDIYELGGNTLGEQVMVVGSCDNQWHSPCRKECDKKPSTPTTTTTTTATTTAIISSSTSMVGDKKSGNHCTIRTATANGKEEG
ncbi:hypothetical protein K431DRAFT_43473 [Polychaeton citri CBS 116435]|uniref:Uncharacterized protein n=1 Tax=Polychaeton citri CBS 116435 TaxID=1314669 RepID=A0A9P4UQC1_9PEZI|nr:hypothetical protein K431DRAFT_43473 [Polychaeton citri CBS 116435]